ncbi:hypothetical protein ABIA35_004625 [Catenulispora sp. MAP12-49]|uniref:hypothetical protein n=1 Tax=unclassified Catenulispora TaxID=414885 RepID=UPI003513CD08
MQVVVLRLLPGTGSRVPALDSAELVGMLKAVATAEHRLEHAMARDVPDGDGAVDVVLFHRGAGMAECETALDLCGRAVAKFPELAGFSVLCRSDEAADVLFMLRLGDGEL